MEKERQTEGKDERKKDEKEIERETAFLGEREENHFSHYNLKNTNTNYSYL